MPDTKPLRFPLPLAPENRLDETDRDAKLVNGYLEQDGEGKIWVVKRPGLTEFSSPGVPVTPP